MKIRVIFIAVFVLVCWNRCLSSSTLVNYVFPSRIVSNAMISRLGDSIGSGIKQAMDHCGEQFKWDQWNCPKTAFIRRPTQKLKLTREIAFARALTTAGIMHAVSRHCAKSGRSQCGCEITSNFLLVEMAKFEAKSPPGKQKSFYEEITTKKPEGSDDDIEVLKNEVKTANEAISWSWGGCSDDPGQAERTMQLLYSEFEKGGDALAYAERQNNLVGQRVVKDSMARQCRCHGLSGSCSHQTCWMEVAPFKDIAENLKKKYKKAIKISYSHVNRGFRLGNAPDMSERSLRRIKPKQLVYLDESPDYCVPDESIGWPGTEGRLCVKENSTDPEERKSCQNLCRDCGYNMRREVMIKTRRCNCAFKMCCEVVCDICEDKFEQFFCA